MRFFLFRLILFFIEHLLTAGGVYYVQAASKVQGLSGLPIIWYEARTQYPWYGS